MNKILIVLALLFLLLGSLGSSIESNSSSMARFEFKDVAVIGEFEITLYSHIPISLKALMPDGISYDLNSLSSVAVATKDRLNQIFPGQEMIFSISYDKTRFNSAACIGAIEDVKYVVVLNLTHGNGQSFTNQFTADSLSCIVDVDQGQYDIYSLSQFGWKLMTTSIDYGGFNNRAGNNTNKGCRIIARTASNTVSVYMLYQNAK